MKQTEAARPTRNQFTKTMRQSNPRQNMVCLTLRFMQLAPKSQNKVTATEEIVIYSEL